MTTPDQEPPQRPIPSPPGTQPPVPHPTNLPQGQTDPNQPTPQQPLVPQQPPTPQQLTGPQQTPPAPPTPIPFTAQVPLQPSTNQPGPGNPGPGASIPNRPLIPNQPLFPNQPAGTPRPAAPNQPLTSQTPGPNQPLSPARPLVPVKPSTAQPSATPQSKSGPPGATSPSSAQRTGSKTGSAPAGSPVQITDPRMLQKPAEQKTPHQLQQEKQTKPAPTPAPQPPSPVQSTTPGKPSAAGIKPSAPSVKSPDAGSSKESKALKSERPSAGKPLQPTRPTPVDKPAEKSRPTAVEKPAAAIRMEQEEPEEDVAKKIVRSVPAWLVSTVIHMAALIVLAMLSRPFFEEKPLEIEVVDYAEEIGDQLIDDSLELQTDSPDNVFEELISFDKIEVEDPLAASIDVNMVLDSLEQVDVIEAPSIGHALAGREPGAKRGLLGKYGGNATTEAAVLRGLEWLTRNQLRDGSWSLLGPFKGLSANTENKTSATAMALLAFLGAGHTHQSGEFRAVVTKGANALLGLQNRDGDFAEGDNPHWTLYAQAQATIALCELYGMTKDEKFKQPAQRAVDYCVSIQSQEGGWKYTPGSGADMSVTGWYVMALQSAKMAELEVQQSTLDNISGFIDSVSHQGGARYGYMPIGYEPTLAMTAEALLCRQYLGWSRDDPRLIDGVQYVNENLIPTTDAGWQEKKDVYYWYYATQLMHHMEGEHWKRWNNVMRQQIPSRQVTTGSEIGSWDNDYDTSGVKAGRLYTTCLCIYMLEVYYRHLPIYQYRGE